MTNTDKRICLMCSRNLAGHPMCEHCSRLLEFDFTDATLCRCGKYHNAPSEKDPRHCRRCMGEPIPTGKPQGDPTSIVEEVEEEINEVEA